MRRSLKATPILAVDSACLRIPHAFLYGGLVTIQSGWELSSEYTNLNSSVEASKWLSARKLTKQT